MNTPLLVIGIVLIAIPVAFFWEFDWKKESDQMLFWLAIIPAACVLLAGVSYIHDAVT